MHYVRLVTGVVSTDDILPARYKHLSVDPQVLAAHVFETRSDWGERLVNSVIVGDSLFGIGSSREQAVTALKSAGVRAVVAPRFGRIFFRNCWNNCLPALTADLNGLVVDGEQVALDLDRGVITTAAGLECSIPRPSPWIHELLDAGGLLLWTQQRVANT